MELTIAKFWEIGTLGSTEMTKFLVSVEHYTLGKCLHACWEGKKTFYFGYSQAMVSTRNTKIFKKSIRKKNSTTQSSLSFSHLIALEAYRHTPWCLSTLQQSLLIEGPQSPVFSRRLLLSVFGRMPPPLLSWVMEVALACCFLFVYGFGLYVPNAKKVKWWREDGRSKCYQPWPCAGNLQLLPAPQKHFLPMLVGL